MKIKDRVVMKDFFISVAMTWLIALVIVVGFLPLLMNIIAANVHEEFPRYMEFLSGATEAVFTILMVIHIVLGALVLQYLRLYVFMGVTRERAFLRIMVIEGLSLLLTFILLALTGSVTGAITGSVGLLEALSKAFQMSLSLTFAFAIGCISSALATTCRPPVSVGVIVAVLFGILWLYGKITSVVEDTTILENIDLTVNGISFGSAPYVSLAFGVVMAALSLLIYKLPLSQLKSTAVN